MSCHKNVWAAEIQKMHQNVWASLLLTRCGSLVGARAILTPWAQLRKSAFQLNPGYFPHFDHILPDFFTVPYGIKMWYFQTAWASLLSTRLKVLVKVHSVKFCRTVKKEYKGKISRVSLQNIQWSWKLSHGLNIAHLSRPGAALTRSNHGGCGPPSGRENHRESVNNKFASHLNRPEHSYSYAKEHSYALNSRGQYCPSSHQTSTPRQE